MRLSEAIATFSKPEGYRVSFEWRRNGMLYSEHFPERDEFPFCSEGVAWNFAEKFAKANPDAVNIRVVDLRWRTTSVRILREHPVGWHK